MGRAKKPDSLTEDEIRRLGDKYWLVEQEKWSVATARQWLARQTCLQHLEKRGYQLHKLKRRR